MAQRVNNSLLNQIGQQKASEQYSLSGLYDDGRNALHMWTVEFIGKHYPVLEVVEQYFVSPYLYYVVSFTTGHLVKFKINEDGLFTLKTVPVFGGVNTPYHRPVIKIGDKQLNIL